MRFSAVYWQTPHKRRKRPMPWVVGIVGVALAAVLIGTMGKRIAYWLLPGDGEATAHALEAFARDLKAGDPFSEAAEAFCLEILNEE